MPTDMTSDGQPTYMTTDDVARLCRTSASTVRYWRHEKCGPVGTMIGRRVLYRRADVEKWLQDRYTAQNGEPAA